MCLVDTLRVLGVKVPYISDGKFWALTDGNIMLEPFDRKLDSIARHLLVLVVNMFCIGTIIS